MVKRVLVIDDDLGISEVMKIILNENGFDAEVISDSKDIVERIGKSKPDVILLDIWMSGVDGRDIVRILKKDNELKKIPVIVISALTNTDKIATEAGADGYLPKPFEISDLLKVVNEHLK